MAPLSKHRLTPMVKGFFLGKFMPPHNGHLYVCDVARRFVDELTVLVCSHDAEPIDGHLRAQWMRDCLDGWGCNLIHMHRDIPQEPKDHPDFWTIWKTAINELHPDPIDYVFGSETYVHQLAQVLNAKPFIVDQSRQVVPVSGTAIRQNAGQNWDHIPPAVRPAFQKRVTLIGPESTGKSTLTDLLGAHFKTKTIPEYGRDYDAIFKQGAHWKDQDFLTIAKGHRAQASAIAAHAGPIVVEDTDVLQTVVWSEALLGTAPQALIDCLQAAPKPDLYLLLSPEMEWRDDGTRYHQSIEDRQWFHARLKHWLDTIDTPWHDVTGTTWKARQDCATQLITAAFG
ncbi:MAG: AAA family ATPase [Paracoccaceae bacterium]